MSYTDHFLLISLCLATRLSYLESSPKSSYCHLCPVLPLHLNVTVLLSHKIFVGFLPDTPALAVNNDPSFSPCFHLCTLWRHPYQSWSFFFFFLCTYNICSLLSKDHTSTLNYLIEIHHPHIIALTEIWINKSSTPSELDNVTLSGYNLLSYSVLQQNHISDKIPLRFLGV